MSEIKADRVSLRMTKREREFLGELAEMEERTPSDVIRRLIRQAARKLHQPRTDATEARDHN